MKRYKYVVKDDKLILDCISIVDAPAVESNFDVFNKDSFKVEGNNILGCILRCDFPIYRRKGDKEYELVFTKEVCDHFLSQILSDTSLLTTSVDHNGVPLNDRVTITGIFQKSSAISVGSDDIADGSVFCTMRVNDPDLLQAIKDHKYNGFSVEICYSELEQLDAYSEVMQLLSGFN